MVSFLEHSCMIVRTGDAPFVFTLHSFDFDFFHA